MRKIFAKSVMTLSLVIIPSLAMAVDTGAPLIAKEEKSVITPVQTVVPASVKPSKIGLFDLTYIGTESEFGKSVKTQLTEKKGALEAKIIAEKKKLDTLKDSIEVKFPTYTPKQRETKSKEFQKRVEAFQKMVRGLEESFMKEQERETGNVFSLIEKTVSDYGKANDYAIIVIKKDLLYVNNTIDAEDLTSIILKAVNDTWKKK